MPCILCNSAQATVIRSYTEPDQYEQTVGVGAEGYFRRWMQCSDCGLHYSVYSRSPEVMDNLYVSAYRANSSSWRADSTERIFDKVIQLPDAESETKFRVRWIKQSIESIWASGIVERGTTPHRLLDVGGATGVFAYEFQDETWKSFVIDPDESGIFLQRRFDIPFLQSAYRAGAFGGSFDLISLVFVLEHMRDPASILRRIPADLKKPRGFLYVEVPSALAFQLKSPEDDIFNACHLWMFDAHTLTRLLHVCGFEVLSMNSVQTKRGHYSLMALAAQK